MNLNQLAKESHEIAKLKGWWDDKCSECGQYGDMIMNMVCELAEAWEEWRNGRLMKEVYYDEKGKPCGIPIEFVDTIIRILDLAVAEGIDLDEAYRIKTKYNKTRKYKHGGKKV